MKRIVICLAVLISACQPSPPQQLVCYSNETPEFLYQGWTMVKSSEKDVITHLKSKGWVEVKYHPGTLACTWWKGRKPALDVPAGAMYWRHTRRTGH